VKSSIDEPPEVELKDLPPHLEYAFLEDDDKLPVIIVKDLKDEEKATLIKVLKYVVPTGRVIATVSIKVPTGRIVPAGYIVPTGRTS
ncbi:hypothetical protein Tco_0240111, partial [Tanacetum coccineum]